MKIGDLVGRPPEYSNKGPVYDHPMDSYLSEVQSRTRRAQNGIKFSHALWCALIIISLALAL